MMTAAHPRILFAPKWVTQGVWLACAVLSLGCQPPASPPGTPRDRFTREPEPTPAPDHDHPSPAEGRRLPHRSAAPLTSAPQPAPAPDPALQPLLERCGPGDAALHRAALRILEPGVGEALDSTDVTFALRTSGGPYVGARGLRLSGKRGDLAAFEAPLAAWLSGLSASETRRCGLASLADSRRGHALGLIVAEALAELEPLPSQVEPGTRLSFRARLLIPATHAELSMLGPRGLPRTIGVELEGEQVTADFYVDTAGLHRLQLMVDREGGPEPALEAWVGVGEAPPTRPLARPAPGEAASRGTTSPHEAVTAMVNAARLDEGVPALRRDSRLDQLAQAHADRMRESQRLAHDLGDGNPLWRVQEAQLGSRATGENLARAGTLRGAHRAIWASPSHRANLLAPHFDSVGIGVARDAFGEWWVCELLADRL